jgi:putative ubiquitin-RnfH superfamily antitoxin RatB of RatAB toxin-antitoxin module
MVMTKKSETIEVVFASPERQKAIKLAVAKGTMLRDVIPMSGIESFFPNHGFSGFAMGVWNKVQEDTYVVKSGDRVEIYRPLVNSAKDARRRRAYVQAAKNRSKAGKS